MAPPRIDITGQRFGKLVAIEPVRVPGRTHLYWRCQCDCGGEKLVGSNHLRSGSIKSCGCLTLAGRQPADSIWTPELDERLELLLETMTHDVAAQMLGLTKNQVIGRAHRIGISRPRPPPKADAEAHAERVRSSKLNLERVRSSRDATLSRPSSTCQWPFGDPREPGFHFCGSACPTPAMPYCEVHIAIAYQPAKASNSDSVDEREPRGVGYWNRAKRLVT